MNMKKVICLLLALVLTAMCLSGCRGKKEEALAEEPAVQVEPAETQPESKPEPEPEEKEEKQEITVVEEQPEEEVGGLEVEDGEFVIEVPEGSELGGD